MATAEFYIVYINRSASATYEDVKKKMDNALDWFRINDSLWVLYTTSNAEKWYGRLSPLVKDSGNVFICKLDVSNRQGWMNKKFWSWLNREKDEK